ncbi:MAG: 16S rRNA (cytidine(1402)-2'-O)-methyltransferase [Gammaproteobacteria bacterium]|nr:MAG: 16S rRNA (cytidine(1402)-2'-O)-methyltransferase [Gammaproteobacteria bacterium]
MSDFVRQSESQNPDVSESTLYLVATPTGNLADITQRAISILKQVDLIAVEDTRHSQRLMTHYGIKTKLLAYHEHNEERITPKLLDTLHSGKSIALISDAGTPLISDPGYRLVTCAHDDDIKVVPVPGVCAAIAALSAVGLATDAFIFEGFPPAKSHARLRFFEQFADKKSTMIFYVSCHKILATLEDMQTVFGADRRVGFAREITKTFETIKRMKLVALIDWVESDANQRKGEIVLVVEGNLTVTKDDTQVDHYLSILLAELSVKQAVSLVIKLTGENKNDVYKRALELKP